jgi:hypothetical protein
MRIQSWAAVFAIGALAVAAGCGSSSTGGGSVDGGSATVTSSGAGGAGTGTTTATSTGSGGSCGTGTGAGGTGNGQACNDCLSTNCNTEFSTCYGPGWKSGMFSGGACSDYLNCTNACPCADITCFQGCQSNITQPCTTCLTAIGTCLQSKCSSECGTGTTSAGTGGSTGAGGSGAGGSTGSGGSTGGSGGGATCADLQSCCNAPQFPAMLKPSCDTVAQSGNESNCAQVLPSFKAAGYCP